MSLTRTEPQAPAGLPHSGRGLRLDGIRHRYSSAAGDVDALARIDLTVDSGEFVCIVGPSGCGKSTLLELVAGLRTPTEGMITLDDRLIVGPSAHRGFVFQQSTSLYPWLTVRGNVELGLKLARVPRPQRRQRVDDELQRVGLTEFANHRVYELSGGMQQRCQIARALVTQPDLLLLDEPFGALDALTRESLQAEIRRLWRASGRTFVFVTHSVEEAVLLASRVIVMSPRPGRVLLDRAVSFSRTDHREADLRQDPRFAAACHDVRLAITQPPTDSREERS